MLPLLASFIFLALRRVLPQVTWLAGLVFGVMPLGVDDPLSPENVDFAILAPRWLAVLLVSSTALLFGMTFAAIAARLDRSVPVLFAGASHTPLRAKLAYASLVWLAIPLYLVPALVYVGVRTVARGRVGSRIDREPVRRAGRVALAAVVVVTVGLAAQAGADII